MKSLREPDLEKIDAGQIGERIVLRDLAQFGNDPEFVPAHGGYAKAFAYGPEQVIKIVYYSRDPFRFAECEYDNLSFIRELNDSRILVPKPHSLAEIANPGANSEIMSYMPHEGMKLYGVVMERISGTSAADMRRSQMQTYEKSFRDLMEAMIEYQLWKKDLKQADIIAIAGGKPEDNRIVMLDVHNIVQGWETIHEEHLFDSLYGTVMHKDMAGREELVSAYEEKATELNPDSLTAFLPERNVRGFEFNNLKKGYFLLDEEEGTDDVD